MVLQLIDMMINAFYGGVGVGFLNYYIYIIIAVFISGLMVGRTPEFLGHKVEAREVKIAAMVTLLSAFLNQRLELRLPLIWWFITLIWTGRKAFCLVE